MTHHYFENDFIKLHYYKYGSGPNSMLCFHGYGMHGKQFKILEPGLGSKYTFYGFDLFFHKETKLKDQGLTAVKKGITKAELAGLITAFCEFENIVRFSVIGYSIGTNFATIIVEELAAMVNEYIVAGPSCLNPGRLILFFSKNKAGNRLLELVTLKGRWLTGLLKLFRKVKLIDDSAYNIIYNEIGTAQLRFNFYACFTYLRFLETDQPRLLQVLEAQNIKSIFIFGNRDRSFPPKIGKRFISRLKNAEVVILNEGHEMIKRNFANSLTNLLT